LADFCSKVEVSFAQNRLFVRLLIRIAGLKAALIEYGLCPPPV